MVKLVKDMAIEASDLLYKRSLAEGCSIKWISWNKPEEGCIKLKTNGIRKVSTGMANVGGLAQDHNGNWVLGFTTKIGIVDNLTTEL